MPSILAHLAALALEPEEDHETPRGAVVLTKLANAIADFSCAIITSAEVDSALGGRESPQWRANALRQVGLKPGRHYRDGVQVRGYLVADIRRAADQYPKTQQDT
jgi:hypothetical protein